MLHGFSSALDLLADINAARRQGLEGAVGASAAARNLYPLLTVTEGEQGWELVGDVPGLEPEGVTISVEGRDLTVSGEPKEPSNEGWTARRTERRKWSFSRTLRFPESIDPDLVEAEVKAGVLRIHVRRSAKPKAIRIGVKGA
jgi:HSP20 family protein